MVLNQIISKIKNIFANNTNQIVAKSVKFFGKVVLDTSHGGKITIGDNCELLNGSMLMTYGGNITIGKNCSINPYTILYGHGNLTIGNNVLIAAHTVIIPANHNFQNINKTINSQGLTALGIKIEDNVWIAANCTILDGVTIGEGAIVAAGTVVNRNVAPYSIVAGVPAKLIKQRS